MDVFSTNGKKEDGMKGKRVFTVLSGLILALILAGCVGMHQAMPEDTACSNNSTSAMLQSGDYKKKVDNFFVIQDASSSMSEKWDNTYAYDSAKLEYSKKLARCMNNTLPDNFDVKAGMRAFGAFDDENGLVYSMAQYSKAGIDNAITAINRTGNLTPLARAIDNTSNDITGMRGKGAVILFSDGLNTVPADPVASAAAMKDKYGDDLCIYTVLIGNAPEGRILLEQIADAGKCGYATDLNAIATADGMNKFVTGVFLEKAPMKMTAPAPAPDIDSDGDGVLDKFDKCPNTPKGIKVDKDGCPIPMQEKVAIALYVQFDFDKATVKPEYYADIEKAANFLKAYPDTKVELDGHTCNIGTEEYNMKLGKRRADSVKAYLVDKFNISPSRLSTVSHGETKPVASNATEDERRKNRRVVATIEAVTSK